MAVNVYEVPTVAAGRFVAEVMTRGGTGAIGAGALASEAMVTAMALLFESSIESRTAKVTFADPAVVPAPKRIPELLRERPAGRLADATDHL
jgi:hypothetical protein